MKKYLALLIGVIAAMVLASTASATLAPGVFDPGNTGCVTSTWNDATQTLELVKDCSTETNAAAGADINGFHGVSLTGLSFTFSEESHCGAGSPRFDVLFTDGSFRIFTCQYGHQTQNEDGTTTVTFDNWTPYCDFASAQPSDCFHPSEGGSKIDQIDILLDEEGWADLSLITVNGKVQVPAPEPPVVVVQPSGPEQTFLCQKYQKPWAVTGPGTSLPAPKLLAEAPGLVASGEWYVPYAIPGTGDSHDNNIGGWRLVCNIDGYKLDGNVLDGSGQLYGPAYMVAFVNGWHTNANIYATAKKSA